MTFTQGLKDLRGCVRDFQAGGGSTPTDFFEMLMKFDGSRS